MRDLVQVSWVCIDSHAPGPDKSWKGATGAAQVGTTRSLEPRFAVQRDLPEPDPCPRLDATRRGVQASARDILQLDVVVLSAPRQVEGPAAG